MHTNAALCDVLKQLLQKAADARRAQAAGEDKNAQEEARQHEERRQQQVAEEEVSARWNSIVGVVAGRVVVVAVAIASPLRPVHAVSSLFPLSPVTTSPS